jgi:hypothetical protein
MNASKTVQAYFAQSDDAFPASPMPSGWALAPAGSDAPWSSVGGTARGGMFSLKSGAIGDDRVSGITFTGNFNAGQVSFSAKVSSEEGYDYFVFFIDDTLMDYGSGEIDWVDVSYPISAGSHTLTWFYFKDEALAAGSDAAWIDSVSLPLAYSGPQPGNYYSVIYKHSNKCQDVRGADGTNGADVIQWPCHGGDNQKLRLVDQGGGYYSLVYKHSGLCTDVYGGGTGAGQKVIQWPCHGGDNQLFTLEDRGGGYYSFRYKHSGQCIDVYGGGTEDAANVIQWPCHGGDNQSFRFEP